MNPVKFFSNSSPPCVGKRFLKFFSRHAKGVFPQRGSILEMEM
jgi:hypothetical protein